MSDPEKFDSFAKTVKEVFPFGLKVKMRLLQLGKIGKRVRVLCPNPAHAGKDPPVYVVAGVWGKKNHLHMACEDPNCHYRMME